MVCFGKEWMDGWMDGIQSNSSEAKIQNNDPEKKKKTQTNEKKNIQKGMFDN